MGRRRWQLEASYNQGGEQAPRQQADVPTKTGGCVLSLVADGWCVEQYLYWYVWWSLRFTLTSFNLEVCALPMLSCLNLRSGICIPGNLGSKKRPDPTGIMHLKKAGVGTVKLCHPFSVRALLVTFGHHCHRKSGHSNSARIQDLGYVPAWGHVIGYCLENRLRPKVAYSKLIRM